jgi:hypothetical protein
MIQHYFNHYDKMISPREYNQSTLIKNLNKKKNQSNKNSKYATSTILGGITDPDEIKTYYTEERKNNMFLRLENSENIKKIKEQQQEILKLTEENIKNKFELEQNRDYILKMEKMISKLKDELYQKNKIIFDKKNNSFSTTKLLGISTITSPNSNNNEEITSEHYKKLKNEIKELRTFKNKIFQISKIYDNINQEIFAALGKIQKLSEELNKSYYNKVNDDYLTINYDFEINCHENIHKTVQEIFNYISKFLKNKQDEYNYLIQTKDIKLDEVMKQKKNLEEKIIKLNESLFEKDNKISNLENEKSILTEIKKEELEKKIREKKKQIRRHTKSFSEQQSGRNVKDQMIRAQKSLVRSIYKIEKGFKENKIKEELIEKMKKF